MKARVPVARSTGTTAAGEETRTLGLIKAKNERLYISGHVIDVFRDPDVYSVQGVFAAWKQRQEMIDWVLSLVRCATLHLLWRTSIGGALYCP